MPDWHVVHILNIQKTFKIVFFKLNHWERRGFTGIVSEYYSVTQFSASDDCLLAIHSRFCSSLLWRWSDGILCISNNSQVTLRNFAVKIKKCISGLQVKLLGSSRGRKLSCNCPHKLLYSFGSVVWKETDDTLLNCGFSFSELTKWWKVCAFGSILWPKWKLLKSSYGLKLF